jgi:hypothetical protein
MYVKYVAWLGSAGLLATGLTPVFAQDTLPDFDNYIPKSEAVRVSEDNAPKIDGDLSDPVWQQAKPFDNFFETEPNEGGRPNERTQVSILYDENKLYIGIYAFDSTPNDIKASIMTRDQGLFPDDRVAIALDPSNTRRDGYFFEVNPNGARREGLIENNSNLRTEWNTIWAAKAQIVDDGWVAEIAIPFRSISYDANAESWGLQVARRLRAENVNVRWANIDETIRNIDLREPGELSGIENVASGNGLEAQIFGTAQFSRDWERPRDDDLTFEPSGNLYYRITPSLTGTLTLNTDFSDTPLDSNQVNTGRFSLFFPETRDFFLQDAAVFEFGGNVFNNPNGLPFFSRRIGIVNGTPTDIVAGAKLSGVVGNTNVGALIANTAELTDSDGNEIDSQTLASVRVSQPVLDESKVGFILTNGDPTGNTDSTVAGVDFQYRKSNLPGDARILADFVAVRSEEDSNTGVPGDASSGNMFGTEVAYRSDKWNGRVMYRDIDEGYNPQLGFASRNGIKQYRGNFFRQFRPNNGIIRFAETGVFTNYITNQDGDLEDRIAGAFFFMNTPNSDRLFGEYLQGRTVLEEGFDIAGELTVPPGTYDFDEYNFEIGFSGIRKVSGEFFVSVNDIYEGERVLISPEVTWRPNKHFEIELDYLWQEFSLPSGNLQIHAATIENNINFSPDMTLGTEIQYNNISESMTWLSQFRWEPKPETEIFVSLGHSAIIEEDNFPERFESLGTSLSFRIGQTFRF